MTVLSGQTIRRLGILAPCHERTRHELTGLTYGLSAAGYDLTLKDDLYLSSIRDSGWGQKSFRLAVANERFHMPDDIIGRVHDKSSLARKGLQVFNTVIEPGWRGWLTIELANNSDEGIWLKAGQPIAQVIFEYLDEPAEAPYRGRYQDQPHEPVEARSLTGEEETI